jgi:hypothetical protein
MLIAAYIRYKPQPQALPEFKPPPSDAGSILDSLLDDGGL